jgi:Tn3 transposase DDE domain
VRTAGAAGRTALRRYLRPRLRRYADPASFLLTPEQWEPQRIEFCHLVGKPTEAADALAQADDELHTALVDLEGQLARGTAGEVRLTGDGELIIPPLTAEDIPAEAETLRDELSGVLPRVPLASVLVELDARTGSTDHLVHAGGKVTRPPELRRNLLDVIIAEATNMGLTAMAESCGVPYDVLAWTAEWYFRPDTLEGANAAIVNYHHRLPLAQAFGTGTLSSSDGQRFPVKGKSITARHLSRYFARGQGLSTYTHASDQHSTYNTKVIVATGRKATTCSTACSATRPTCRCSSTPPTPLARRWRTSRCSTWWTGSSPHASGISARSPCTGPGHGKTSPTGTRAAGRC